MPLRIKNITIVPLRAKLNQPFRTALGTHQKLDNILLTLQLADGTKAAGEAAIATHITGETVEETTRNLEYMKSTMLGEPVDQYLRLSERLHRELGQNPCAIAAAETALLDAFCRSQKMPLWRFFGKKCAVLKSDITIVIADLKETEASVKKYFRQGFRAFKVKVGRDRDLDVKRLISIGRLAPKSKIYVDANQGYTADEMLQFLAECQRHRARIDLIEQPVPKDDWDGLKKISTMSKVPVCADESVRSLEDARKAIKKRLAPVINVKMMKSGLLHAQKIARLAQYHGVKLMIGGMMESSLAMTASAHLAAGMDCFDYIDLDTPFFIQDAVKKNPFLSNDGVYDLRKVKEGIGITV